VRRRGKEDILVTSWGDDQARGAVLQHERTLKLNGLFTTLEGTAALIRRVRVWFG
jgi:hypothetical protein